MPARHCDADDHAREHVGERRGSHWIHPAALRMPDRPMKFDDAQKRHIDALIAARLVRERRGHARELHALTEERDRLRAERDWYRAREQDRLGARLRRWWTS